MGFVDSFKKSFSEELRKQNEPHIRTALVNMFANFDHDLVEEITDHEWDRLTDDFIAYFVASLKADKG